MEIPLLTATPKRPNGSAQERDQPGIPQWISRDPRDGAAVRVQSDSKAHRMQDLREKRTAAPDRFSTRLAAAAAAT
jgi:hypothetical protein